MIMSSIDKGLKCFYDRTVQRLLDNVHASQTVNPVFFFFAVNVYILKSILCLQLILGKDSHFYCEC